MALTIIPTLALVFGFFDVSIMQFRWLTLQNAIREGSRYAVTFQTQSGQGQNASIKNVVEQYALGFAKTSDSPATIFVNYYNPDLTSGSNIPGNVVEVSVSVPFSWIAPLSGTANGSGSYASGSFTISASSADVLGGYPVGVTSVAQ